MTHIFISYNREDQFRARMIADALQAEGLDVWWDTNLRAGESYDEVTEKHLREAGAVVVLWSPKSANSKWVRAEATVGERFSKLVPAMIEECERPLRFELVQTADLINWQGDRSDPNWRLFMQGVKSAVGHQETPSPVQAASPSASSGGSADAANDITIENTFWTSVKDGSEAADFEAYLKRYPEGHFADLARNRLTALQRAAQPKPVAPPPSAPAPQTKNLRPAPAPIAAAPNQPASQSASRAPAPQPHKKSGAGGMIALVGIAAVLIGGGVFAAMQFMGGDAIEETQSVAAVMEEEPALEEDSPASATIEMAEMADTSGVEGAVEVAAGEGADNLEEVSEDVADELAALDSGADALAEPEEEIVEEAAPVDDGASSTFADCEGCPVMTVLPGGLFTMGSSRDEPGHVGYEGPQHEVTVPSFAISETEVTHEQWLACVNDGGCGAYSPGDAGLGREKRPVIFISWRDAQNYVKWLSAKTGKTYRLPTEAEWEYAARGGTQYAYWWGDRFDRNMATLGTTQPVDTLAPNPYGLRGMLGNAAEWVQDCYINNYGATPADGSAMTSGDCGRRVIRGGSWRDQSPSLRSANRGRITQTVRDRSMGFRVAMSVN